jgi:hypothetical protein
VHPGGEIRSRTHQLDLCPGSWLDDLHLVSGNNETGNDPSSLMAEALSRPSGEEGR